MSIVLPVQVTCHAGGIFFSMSTVLNIKKILPGSHYNVTYRTNSVNRSRKLNSTTTLSSMILPKTQPCHLYIKSAFDSYLIR